MDGDEWEEILIVTELPQNCEVTKYPKTESSMEILGLATETPLVRLHNQLFSGEYQEPFGSKLILEIEEESAVSEKGDKSEEKKIDVKETFVVNKILKLDRIYLKPNESDEQNEPEASSSAEKS